LPEASTHPPSPKTAAAICPTPSATASKTAGGIVFFRDESGALAAADAKSGKLLWHFYSNQP